MSKLRTFAVLLISFGCTDEPEPEPTPNNEEGTTSAETENDESAATLGSEELENRRNQVLAQLNELRDRVTSNPFDRIAVDPPVPSTVPGIDGHRWTTEDTEQFGLYSWSPTGARDGVTYGQFQVLVDSETQAFTVVATMDLDADGVTSRATATEGTEARVENPSDW